MYYKKDPSLLSPSSFFIILLIYVLIELFHFKSALLSVFEHLKQQVVLKMDYYYSYCVHRGIVCICL